MKRILLSLVAVSTLPTMAFAQTVLFDSASDALNKSTTANTNVGLTDNGGGSYTLANSSGVGQAAAFYGYFNATTLAVGDTLTLDFTVQLESTSGSAINLYLQGSRGVTLKSGAFAYDDLERSYAGYGYQQQVASTSGSYRERDGGPAGNTTQDRNFFDDGVAGFTGTTVDFADRLEIGDSVDFTFTIGRTATNYTFATTMQGSSSSGPVTFPTATFTPSGNQLQLTDAFDTVAVGYGFGGLPDSESFTVSGLTVTFTPVPEPNTALLLGLSAAGSLIFTRRRRARLVR